MAKRCNCSQGCCVGAGVMARVWILAPGVRHGGVLMVSRAYLHPGMRMEGCG